MVRRKSETAEPSNLTCPFFALPQMRDLRSVGAKLKIVLNPRGDQDGVLTKLKDCEWQTGCAFVYWLGPLRQ